MITTAITAIAGTTIILLGWLSVQAGWRFVTGSPPQQDALAGRLGCQRCGCNWSCARAAANTSSESSPHSGHQRVNEQAD